MRENQDKTEKDPIDVTNSAEYKGLMKIPSRLVIKDIPATLSDEKIIDIFTKNFDENEIKKDMIVIKLQKKYSLKDRNKICFLTVNNFEIRQKLLNFISEFELVSQKGIKQKLTVNDCLFQKKYKDEEDPVNNTLKDLEHFKKFKEYLEKDKILDFKNEENNLLDGIFDNIELKNNNNTGVNQSNNTDGINSKNSGDVNKKKITTKEPEKKMTIITNENPIIQNGFEDNDDDNNDNNKNIINNNGNEVEILQESKDYNKGGKYNEKRGKGGYYNSKKNNYNNSNYNYDNYNNSYNNNYNDQYNYKHKDYNYNYGGRNNYKSGYNDYNDYNDYGKNSYKKKNYYKGGYK